MPFGEFSPVASVLTSRLPLLSTMRIDLVEGAMLTKTVPLSPIRSERAFVTPLAKTSILKSFGSFKLRHRQLVGGGRNRQRHLRREMRLLGRAGRALHP